VTIWESRLLYVFVFVFLHFFLFLLDRICLGELVDVLGSAENWNDFTSLILFQIGFGLAAHRADEASEAGKISDTNTPIAVNVK
jgi:hypothetical protein